MKRLLCVFVLTVLLLSVCAPCYAHDREDHNRLLEEVFFGWDRPISALSEKSREALTALEYASYLAIDQFNGKGIDELSYLRNTYKVPGLPRSIESFDFSANQYHRSYTHRGWDYEYTDDKANWKERKNILLATTQKVFDFGLPSGKVLWHDFGYSKKCESVAAFIYYVHILGDYEARENYMTKDIVMPFAQATHSAANPDVISEIKFHLQTIFEDQQDTRKYRALMQELDYIGEKTRALAATVGGIDSDEKFKEFHDQVISLKTLLQDYIPNMLQDENFFMDVFKV